MTYQKNNLNFEKMLLKFFVEPDLVLSIPEWLCRAAVYYKYTDHFWIFQKGMKIMIAITIAPKSAIGVAQVMPLIPVR